MYKMVAVDMDGTLLNDEHQLTEENILAVQKAQELGVKVVPFTGRAFYTIIDIARQLKLRDAAATQNASTVVNPLDGSILFQNTIPPEICRDILFHAQEQGLLPMVYQGDLVYTKMKGKYLDIFEKCMFMKATYIDDVLKIYNGEPLGKILLMDDPEKLNTFNDWLMEEHGDQIFAGYSYEFALEIGSISKGKQMLQVAKYLDISPNEIMAIGDGHNDLDMLNRAGFAVAMENAMDVVKSKADFITKSNNNSGVAHAINRFILKR